VSGSASAPATYHIFIFRLSDQHLLRRFCSFLFLVSVDTCITGFWIAYVGEHVENFFWRNNFPGRFRYGSFEFFSLTLRRYVADAMAGISQIALVRLVTGIPVLHKRRVIDTDGIRRSIIPGIPILPLLDCYAMLFRINR